MRRTDLLALALFALAASAEAAARQAGVIEARAAWSRPATAGLNGVGYLVLINRGRAPEALVGVETTLARKVEIHNSAMRSGVMSMQPQGRVMIPPGGSVAFAPGGRHLMLIDMRRSSKLGDKIPATLVFASGKRLKLDFLVGLSPPPAN